MKVPFVRSPYNYDRDQASEDSGLECRDKSLAQQSMAEECDINTIVRRFGLTGQLPSSLVLPQYVDYSNVVDFHSAMNAVARAGEAFDSLPADMRARFHNSPQEFLEFCADDKNRPEAIKLGLVRDQAVDLASPPATPPGSAVAPVAPSPAPPDTGGASGPGATPPKAS